MHAGVFFFHALQKIKLEGMRFMIRNCCKQNMLNGISVQICLNKLEYDFCSKSLIYHTQKYKFHVTTSMTSQLGYFYNSHSVITTYFYSDTCIIFI